jgi:hypothetical protein
MHLKKLIIVKEIKEINFINLTTIIFRLYFRQLLIFESYRFFQSKRFSYDHQRISIKKLLKNIFA